MKASKEIIAAVRKHEAYAKRLPNGDCQSYLCPSKVWTIGWGTTLGVKPGMVWSVEQAEAAYQRDIKRFEDTVNKYVTVPLTQNQFDALFSLTYNIGEGNLAKSTLLKKLNKGDYGGAAREFPRWNRSRGKVTKGLITRRATEMALFKK